MGVMSYFIGLGLVLIFQPRVQPCGDPLRSPPISDILLKADPTEAYRAAALTGKSMKAILNSNGKLRRAVSIGDGAAISQAM